MLENRPLAILLETVAFAGLAIGGNAAAMAQTPQNPYSQNPASQAPAQHAVRPLTAQEVYDMVHERSTGQNDTYMEGFNSAQSEYRPGQIQPKLPIWRNGAEYAWVESYANYFAQAGAQTEQFANAVAPTTAKTPYQNGRDAGAADLYQRHVAPELARLLLSIPLQQLEAQHAFTGKGAEEAMRRCQVPNYSGLPQYAPGREVQQNPLAVTARMFDMAHDMQNFAACLNGAVHGAGFNIGSRFRIDLGPTQGRNWTNDIANIAQQTAQNVEANRSTMQNFINYLPPAPQQYAPQPVPQQPAPHNPYSPLGAKLELPVPNKQLEGLAI